MTYLQKRVKIWHNMFEKSPLKYPPATPNMYYFNVKVNGRKYSNQYPAMNLTIYFHSELRLLSKTNLTLLY